MPDGDPASQGAGEGRRVAGSAAITAALQVASMAVGAIFALLILRQFGKSPQTDGLLAAYGVYGLVLVVAGTLRTTIVAPLTQSGRPLERVNDFLGAATLVVAGTALPFVLLASPVASLLTGDLGSEAQDAATTALICFWAAAAGQLIVAVAAAALAVRAEFALPGAAYVVAGLTSIAVLLTAGDALGTDAAALGVAGGGVLAAALLLVRLRRVGWRPRALFRRGTTLRSAALMLTGAVGVVGWQACYVITLAFAARLGPGEVTLYTYAFFAAGMLIGATGGSASIVMAAPIAEDWDGEPAWLRPPTLDVLRAGLTIIVPVLGGAALIGDDVLELLLGADLTRADEVTIVTCLMILAPVITAHLAGSVSTLAAFAHRRYGALALIAIAAVAVHVGLSAIALTGDTLEWLTAATVGTTLFLLTGTVWLVQRHETPRTLAVIAAEALRYAVTGALAFGPLGALAADTGGGAQLAAFVAGLAIFAGLLRLQPLRWDVARRMAEPFTARLGAA
jgi:hypothetical protein